MTVTVEQLPVEIQTSDRAVVWKRETRDGTPTKVPYQATRPAERAAVDNPTTWASFAVAMETYEDGKADGVGIVLGPMGDRTLTGVDLDKCRDPRTGRIDADAQAIVAELASYTEVSPSGTGVHILVYGNLPPGRRRKGTIEMYCDGRYFTVTGAHLAGTPTTIGQRASQLATLHARIFSSNGHATPATQPRVVSLDLDDDALLTRARAAQNGGLFSRLWDGDVSGHDSASEADLALCNLLAFWTGADAGRIDQLFRSSGLWREKWDAQRGEHTYGQRTIATAIASCSDIYRGPPMPREARSAPAASTAAAASSGSTGTRAVPQTVTLDDLHAYMPEHRYLFGPTRDLWPAASVNARVPPVALVDEQGAPVLDEDGTPRVVKAAAWLDRYRPVEQMTWVPGKPMLIRDYFVFEGGWIARPGCTTFNLYRPPCLEHGDPTQAGPWCDHIRAVYPEEADHIIAWLAQRVQRPEEKINHALVLGGSQGIGKDTILAPIKDAIGPWNFIEVSPAHLLGRFNGFVKSVILRISEARDLGDVKRFTFYDHSKNYTAAPPDVLRVDEKNLREHAVWNVTGVVITSNHRTDGLYLPADDRRHFVAWSERTKADFSEAYWTRLWDWYDHGGTGHVAAFLAGYDLSRFNAKAPPPRTPAFHAIVDANRAPEDAELADALDHLEWPSVVTLADLAGSVPSEFSTWLQDRANARQVPYRLESVGYVAVRNPAAQDGLWKLNGRRQAMYAQHDLPLRDQIIAARTLVKER